MFALLKSIEIDRSVGVCKCAVALALCYEPCAQPCSMRALPHFAALMLSHCGDIGGDAHRQANSTPSMLGAQGGSSDVMGGDVDLMNGSNGSSSGGGGMAGDNSALSTMLDYEVMKSNCLMLQCLGLFDSAFEPCLVKDSLRFFTAKAANLMESLSISQYLLHVEFRLGQAGAMVTRYLTCESTRYALINVLESTLLAPKHTAVLIEEGLPVLLKEHRVDGVTKLYSMVSRLNQNNVLELLRGQWIRYIRYLEC